VTKNEVVYFLLKQKPDRDEWGTGLDAMQVALTLEKNVNQSLLDLHGVADKHGDAQVGTIHIIQRNSDMNYCEKASIRMHFFIQLQYIVSHELLMNINTFELFSE